MPKNPSKRYKKALTLVDANKAYPLPQAVEVLQKFPKAKFNETVDLAFRLGVDPKQSDQMVRGTVPLPHGSGKTVKVLVFAKSGPAADAAKAAGAEFVGFDDMIKKCTDGWTDFDVAIATPDAMSEVRKLGKVLGPRGLMPNPKTGTVTEDTAKAVKEVKAGREDRLIPDLRLRARVREHDRAPRGLDRVDDLRYELGAEMSRPRKALDDRRDQRVHRDPLPFRAAHDRPLLRGRSDAE